jgi:DNA-binding response OmpR family regulator
LDSIKKRVLIVEDDVDVAMFQADALIGMGFEVLEARDGVKGLKIAQSEHFDLIIVDLTLPMMDGCELCRRLRESPATQRLPILIVTARSSIDPDAAHAYILMAEGAVLLKPYEAHEFRDKVRALLDG